MNYDVQVLKAGLARHAQRICAHALVPRHGAFTLSTSLVTR